MLPRSRKEETCNNMNPFILGTVSWELRVLEPEFDILMIYFKDIWRLVPRPGDMVGLFVRNLASQSS